MLLNNTSIHRNGNIMLFSFFILFLTIINQGCNHSKSGKDEKQKPNVAVEASILGPSELTEEITVSGTLHAMETVDIKPEITGRVTDIQIPEGQEVKKGSLLVKLFDEDIQAQLSKLIAQKKLQEEIVARQNELLSVEGISKNDYEQGVLQVNTLSADIEIQKVLLGKTEIKAPFDGTVGLRNISIGTLVNSGTILTTLSTSHRLKLDFSVPEKYSSFIHTGSQVSFRISGISSPFSATVMATDQGIDESTRNLTVRAVVNEDNPALLPGMYVNVSLLIRHIKNALLIPTQTIIPKEKSKSVIISKNGKAHFCTIQTGIRKEDSIEVTDGIQAGDTLILNGLLFLKEGSLLKFSRINH